LAAENWKERWPNEEMGLGMTSEIYLLREEASDVNMHETKAFTVTEVNI
jgi:hypothetical protein